ncbi:hypothetical protein [Streptomyces sp. NPDC059460]|uniref:hypothetical protein n=1 Tax=Streptomyces sp. NPDC059460 TaxID=3346840 RepID=UPI003688949E
MQWKGLAYQGKGSRQVVGAEHSVEALVEILRENRRELRSVLAKCAGGRATSRERQAVRHPELRAVCQGALAYLQAKTRGMLLVNGLAAESRADERRFLSARLDAFRGLGVEIQSPYAAGGVPRPLRMSLEQRTFAELCGALIEEELARSRQERGLGAEAFTPASRDLWGWAAENGWVRNSLSPRASRLRTIPDKEFIDEVLRDADAPNPTMMHPAVVQRRAATSGRAAEVRTVAVREAFERARRLRQAETEPLEPSNAAVWRASEALARVEDRSAEARVRHQEFLSQFDQAGTMPSARYQQLWHLCTFTAFARAASREADLWQRIGAASAAHRMAARHAGSPGSCREECVLAVLDILTRPGTDRASAAEPAAALQSPVGASPGVTSKIPASRPQPREVTSPGAGERLVVIASCYRPDCGSAGVAWVSDGDRSGSTRVDARAHLDAEVLAIVEAATALAGEGPLFVASVEPMAVHTVNLALTTGRLPTDRLFRKISATTRERLAALVASGPGMRVAHTSSRWKEERKRARSAALDELPPVPSAKTAKVAKVPGTDPLALLGAGADLGRPYGLSVKDRLVTWSQPVTRRHLAEGWVPLPGHDSGIFRELTSVPVAIRVRVRHDGLVGRSIPARQRVGLQTDAGTRRITGISWPAHLKPGTLLFCTWQRGGQELEFATRVLKRRISADGNLLTHEYDLRVLTRDGLDEVVVGGLSQKHLVIRTLRGLGYLDEYGRALLAEEDLIWNVLEEAKTRRHPVARQEVAQAIRELVDSGRLTTVQGSRNRIGHLIYPARSGEPKVDLLCWTPTAPKPQHETPVGREKLPVHLTHKHDVRGHLRRIDGVPSDEAADAFRKDRELTRLVGSKELPRGMTYIRCHDRGQ